MKRHIVLLGLPGSGKTTVGTTVAERLGAPFVDLDGVISRRMRMTVPQVFAEHGEARFRELERQAMKDVLAQDPSVIAPGGGWAAQPGQLELARDRSFFVYLRTLASTAARRAEAQEGRPLLGGQNPVDRMVALMREREPFYQRADAEVHNDVKSVADAAAEIVELARREAGW